jgi:CubicO group peptidase (beta-lactamase class C family)
VLERATGEAVSAYMARVLWGPLGAAADATWSLDSERSKFEKLESGINATARDYARFGALYLHGGHWNGHQIVSREWVRRSTAVYAPTDSPNPYGYLWWVDGQRPGRFYAVGNLGQFVYVDPVASTVIVRLGSAWGYDTDHWLPRFREIATRAAIHR